MASEQRSLLDRLRRPEYTGPNRCLPCTAVNLVIAVALTVAVGVVFLPAAPVVLVLSLAAIYLRGYLVPGTPTLTKRYFPDWLLAKFDKPPADGVAATEDVADDSPTNEPPVDRADPERVFLEHEILVPCLADSAEPVDEDAADDLCLTDPIRSAWRDEIDALRDGDREQQVATFLEADPETVLVDRTSDRVLARVDGRLAARWESDAALLADLAAARVLADRLPGWDRRSIDAQSQLANGLRAFVDACPTCGGPISLDEATVESCCRSREVYAITCNECDVRVLEVPK